MTSIWGFLLCTLAASVTAALLLAVKRLLEDKIPPSWQYGVWGVLLLRLALPFGLDGSSGRQVLLPLPEWVETLKTLCEQHLDSAYDSPFALTRVFAPVGWLPGAPRSAADWLFVLYLAGAALALGLPLEKITLALAKSSGVKGRAEVVPTPGKDYTVLIDYSHTPDSLENILRTVRGFCRGRLIAVFGCGGDRDRLKRPIMGEAAGRLADLSIVTSDNPRTEKPMDIIDDIVAGMQDAPHPYRVIENRVEAIEWALAHAQPDDVIVLCGKGHETYQEVNHVKHHMDEREIVAAYLERER